MSLVINAFAESLGIARMTVSNQRLLRETESRPITNIVRQHQLWLYGHVARYPEADPTCRVVSERENPEWRRPRGPPTKFVAGESRYFFLGVTIFDGL